MRLLLIDNYDSFTWNLVHYLEELIPDKITVIRNDEITPRQLSSFDRLILSPGPGLPSESGNLMESIAEAVEKMPVLGVCLGLQALVEHYGGKLMQLPTVVHGLQRDCHIVQDDPIFEDIPRKFAAGRYHSWVADRETFPSCFDILAVDELLAIMAIKHKTLPVYGLQFHPESIMTPDGKAILKNWLNTN